MKIHLNSKETTESFDDNDLDSKIKYRRLELIEAQIDESFSAEKKNNAITLLCNTASAVAIIQLIIIVLFLLGIFNIN